MAQEQSMDTGSRSLGGLLAEPITRHAHPTTISDAAFIQLVDGDPRDKDPSHKPKDGDFSGPIQADEMSWIILRRESVIPAVKGADLKDPQVRQQSYDLIYEVKLKETLGLYFQELIKQSAIENQLTGTVKLANEEKDPEYGVDRDVKLMSNSPDGRGSDAQPGAQPTAGARPKLPTPAALSPDAAQQYDKLKRPLRSSSDAPNATDSGTSSPSPASPN
jgi:foldase protein PrsA